MAGFIARSLSLLAAAFLFCACSPSNERDQPETVLNPDINDSVIGAYLPKFKTGKLSADGISKLGAALVRNGDTENAQKCFESLKSLGAQDAASALDSEIRGMRFFLLENAVRRLDPARYSELCSEILKFGGEGDAGNLKALGFKGFENSLKDERYDAADKFLLAVLEIAPDSAEALSKRVKALFESENYAAAAAAAEEALKKGVNGVELESYLFNALVLSGRAGEADKFAASLPEGVSRTLLLARGAARRGNLDEAAGMYFKFVDPRVGVGPEAYYEAGSFFLENDRNAEISEMIKFIVNGVGGREYFDKSAELFARALILNKNYFKARTVLTGLLRHRKDDVGLLLMLAKISAVRNEEYSMNLLERAALHIPGADEFRIRYLEGVSPDSDVRTRIFAGEFIRALADKYLSGAGKPSNRASFLKALSGLSKMGNIDADAALDRFSESEKK